MRSRILFTAFVLSSLCVAGSAQQNVRVLETPFYPLKPGNTWRYRSGDHKVTVRVDKLELLESKKDDKVEKVPAHRLVITKDDREKAEYVAVLDDGVYRFVGDGKTMNPPLRFFKLPLKKGESWEVNTVLEGMPLTGTFTANEADVKVPAGDFKAMTVSSSDLQIGSQRMKMEYWFVPDKGIVKQWVKLGAYEVVLELEEFVPAK